MNSVLYTHFSTPRCPRVLCTHSTHSSNPRIPMYSLFYSFESRSPMYTFEGSCRGVKTVKTVHVCVDVD